MESSTLHCVGIDENGLGARLGPLVVTAVVARVTASGAHAIESWRTRKAQPLLNDSKRLVAHGDVRLAEAWARVLAGSEVTHPAELVEAVTLLPTKQLKQRCPSNARVQCWQHRGERFKAGDFLVADVMRALQKLNKLGITPIRVLSRLVCTAELNARGAHGENRFLVDLHSMEELIVHIADTVRPPITVVCGKVGSMSAYTQHFAHLNPKQPQIACESPEQSIYQVASFGELRFIRDADATDPLVMLASLVGKYLRELFVERIGHHFTTELTQLRRPSGYHDPITAQFADATEALRTKASFPQDCFERARPRGL